MLSPRVRAGLMMTALTGLYFLAGKLGLSLAIVNESTTAVWPPAGIAVAALLLLGLRAWPVAAAGAFLVNITTSAGVVASLFIATGNTLEAVAAAWLANRYARGVLAFERPADILRFTLLGPGLSTMIGATIGTITLRVAGLAPPGTVAPVWATWWLGDMVGMALVAPMVTLWLIERPPAPVRGEVREGVLLALCLAGTTYIAFGTLPAGIDNVPLAIFVAPLMLWSAFRFGPRITATLVVAIAVIAVYSAINRLGPLIRDNPNVSLLFVQLFIGTLGPLMLSVAAEVTARDRVEQDMRALNATLEGRVADRTEELTRVHDRLLEAQRVAHVGSWEWDLDLDSLWWSDEMCRIFGVDRPPANFEDYISSVYPEDRERTIKLVSDANARKSSFTFEHRIVRSDGEVRVLYARGRVEADDSGRVVRMMGIGHDITDLKQAEEERAQLIHEQAARHEAEEANRVKDAFLATLSHELRTPLNAALGWAHILRNQLHAERGETRAADAIYRNLLIQSQIVSDILDISRIAKGGLPLETEAIPLNPIVAASIEMVAATAKSRMVTVDVHTIGTPVVIGDSRRLQQVTWNLLSNAVKFASEGGRVTVTIAEEADLATITVEDDGPGIAPDFLPHVFEQFRQADPSVTRVHGGLGLGLAIAHHIVGLHNGTIEAGNRESGGAIFTVRLPRQVGAVAPELPDKAGISAGSR